MAAGDAPGIADSAIQRRERDRRGPWAARPDRAPSANNCWYFQPHQSVRALRQRSGAPGFARAIPGIEHGTGPPASILADTGFASVGTVAALEARNVAPLVAIGRTRPHRAHDFRPPPQPKARRRMTGPWCRDMRARLRTNQAGARYARRKQAAEAVFGIVIAGGWNVRRHG